MTLRDVGQLVESYVSSTEHERGQMYLNTMGDLVFLDLTG